jgi:hypothetical protein
MLIVHHLCINNAQKVRLRKFFLFRQQTANPGHNREMTRIGWPPVGVAGGARFRLDRLRQPSPGPSPRIQGGPQKFEATLPRNLPMDSGRTTEINTNWAFHDQGFCPEKKSSLFFMSLLLLGSFSMPPRWGWGRLVNGPAGYNHVIPTGFFFFSGPASFGVLFHAAPLGLGKGWSRGRPAITMSSLRDLCGLGGFYIYPINMPLLTELGVRPPLRWRTFWR